MGRSVWRRYTARSTGRQMCTSCTLSHGSRSDRCGALPRDPCVAVPIAEAPDQLVAAARGRGGGEVPPAGQLELPLRPVRGPKQGLGVAWQEERRGGRRRLREQGGHEGEERVHGNASGMYTPGGRACVPRRGDAFSPSPPFRRQAPCPLVRCRSASRCCLSCLVAPRAARPPRPPLMTRPCSPASSGGRSGSCGGGAP